MAAIIERDGKFLIIEEDTVDGLRWNQPAGHLEYGESFAEAVVRETLEETAHPFEPTGLLGVYLTPSQGKSYLRFAFVGAVGAPVPGHALDVGIHRAFWVTVDELRARPELHRGPVVMRCIEDYLRAQRENTPWLPLSSLAYLDDGAE